MRDADSIAVVFKGKIIEQGAHDKVRHGLVAFFRFKCCSTLCCLQLLCTALLLQPHPACLSYSSTQLMAIPHGSYARLVRHQLTRTTTSSLSTRGPSFLRQGTSRRGLHSPAAGGSTVGKAP